MVRFRRIALLSLLLVAACSSSSESSSSAETAPPAVVRDVLGTMENPPGADGRTLTLIRYTIPAGAQLVPHIHPGVQVARIASGELTYTVVEGTAIVRRSGAEQDEQVAAPATITLVAGDTITEVDGMVHFGANDTESDVVIGATLLTKEDEDLAVPVTVSGDG